MQRVRVGAEELISVNAKWASDRTDLHIQTHHKNPLDILTVNQLINQTLSQSVSQSVSQEIRQSVEQSVSPSMNPIKPRIS